MAGRFGDAPVHRVQVSVGTDVYTLAYQSYPGQGDSAAQPWVILLHGFLGDRTTWYSLLPHLSPPLPCLALDLLGFGQSDKPRLRYTIWHQVMALHGVIQALGLERVALVGHSYGGWVAAAYGLAIAGWGWAVDYDGWVAPGGAGVFLPQPYPALTGLALVAAAGIRDDQFLGRYDALRPLLWESRWVDWAIALAAGPMALLGQGARHGEIRRARTALQAQPVAKSFLVDRLRPEDAIDTVEAHLAHVTPPTLVFAGDQDTTIPFWHGQTYAQGLPQAEFIPCPGAGHDLPQSHASAIAAPLLAAWAGGISP